MWSIAGRRLVMLLLKVKRRGFRGSGGLVLGFGGLGVQGFKVKGSGSKIFGGFDESGFQMKVVSR